MNTNRQSVLLFVFIRGLKRVLMSEAVIIDCLRTPVGKAPRGTLRNARPDDLGAVVIRALLDRYPEAKDSVEDVILGCAMPEGEAGNNMARQSLLRAGLPDTVT